MNEHLLSTMAGARPRSGRGFTLIELMIALTLSLFLIGAIILVYLSGRAASSDSAQLSRMQENVRFASDYLIRDLRNAGFIDETELFLGSADQILGRYADIVNAEGVSVAAGNILRVRYAGRGHCRENFQTLRVVENEYSVVDGRLVCRGRSAQNTTDSAGNVVIVNLEVQPFSDRVDLVAGVRSVSFRRICGAGVANCVSCDLSSATGALASACIGVEARLEFEGLRAGVGFDTRALELRGAFRNIVLARLNAG
jgi:prepilin-type N-terminal cleavage/methylation domain-containing protein